MLMSEMSTLFSLITRTLRIDPGQHASAPLFVINTLQNADFTLTAHHDTETLKVGDHDVECVVCDATGGSRYWLDRKTGALVRARIDAQKVVIDAVTMP
jgi:hypothetical protein